MSSPSRIRNASDVVVVGGWQAAVVAAALAERGAKCLWLRRRERADRLETLPVYVGNGERAENARKIMGDALAGKLWDLSAKNLERARKLGIELPVRWDSEAPQAGALVAIADLAKRAEDVGAQVVSIDDVDTVERAGPLSVRIRARSPQPLVLESSIAIFASDELSPSLLPSLADKRVPVTLTWLRHRPVSPAAAGLTLFNQGADFSVSEPSGTVRLGSFRNLFEDRAVGVHDAPDEVTLKNLRRFFQVTDEVDVGVSVESLGCDGLPVVGGLAEVPGTFALTGFSARAPNFLFEIAAVLADGILHDKGFAPLEIFSTKRFT